jgi:hypothetical protein
MTPRNNPGYELPSFLKGETSQHHRQCLWLEASAGLPSLQSTQTCWCERGIAASGAAVANRDGEKSTHRSARGEGVRGSYLWEGMVGVEGAQDLQAEGQRRWGRRSPHWGKARWWSSRHRSHQGERNGSLAVWVSCSYVIYYVVVTPIITSRNDPSYG